MGIGPRLRSSMRKLKGRFARLACLPAIAMLASTSTLMGAESDLKADEWRLIGRDSEQHQFSPLRQITTENIKTLGLAWFADMPTKDGMVGVPLVAEGLVFQSGSLGKVFATDART